MHIIANDDRFDTSHSDRRAIGRWGLLDGHVGLQVLLQSFCSNGRSHTPTGKAAARHDRSLPCNLCHSILGLIFFGSLEMVAVFCVAGAIMGLGDGLIYSQAGFTHWKHTITGILALVGLIIALYYIE